MNVDIKKSFSKYLAIFKISIVYEFVYKATFVLWRFRNVIQILLVFFIWDAVYTNQSTNIFGYDKSKILSYVFGLIIVRALVLSSKAGQISNEISLGDLSNYLLKPIPLFRYWFMRDIAVKVLNIVFAVVEGLILFILFKPPLYIQTDLMILMAFAVMVAMAIVIYFLLTLLVSSIPFWYPEGGWGSQFLLTAIFVEFLSGGVFPLDVLPKGWLTALSFTPFPYLVYFPLQTYLGKVSGSATVFVIGIGLIWIGILMRLLKVVWSRGMGVYGAYGR